jgi:hypothetical protein
MRTRRELVTLLLLFLTLGLSGQSAAHGKTDVLFFYNGDKLTGEIKHLLSGLLEFKTDSMGTIQIEWQDIARLESDYNYDIRLSDGSRLFGSIEDSTIPGELAVSDLDGNRALQWLEVVEMRPIEDDWRQRLDVYLSMGYAYTKASSVTQTTVNTEISYKDENATNSLTARQTNTMTDEQVSSSSLANLTRQVWTDKSGRFRSVWGSYESNDELGLDHRYAGGIGLGNMFVDTHRMSWSGTAGIQVLTEKTSNGGDADQSFEGSLVSDFRMWRLNTPKLDLSLIVRAYPNLSDLNRLRGDTNLRLSWEIIKDLYWDITAWGTFDDSADTEASSDYGITTGVGWKY